MTVRWRALGDAFKQAWPVWLALGVSIATIAACWRLTSSHTKAVLYAGTLYELAGLATVVVGLRHMRQSFGKPSLLTSAIAWIGRVGSAFIPPRTIEVRGTAMGSATVFGEGRVTRTAPHDATAEARIAVLEENLKQLRDEMDTKVAQLKGGVAAVNDAIVRESRERQAQDDRTASKLEEIAAGGLHLEAVGVVWLFLGILGTSIPDEVAGWLGMIFG